MPLRELACPDCQEVEEIYHTAVDPAKVPLHNCLRCGLQMQMLWSTCKIDTSDSFHPFDYKGPDGRAWNIDNLHKLRAVEHAYLETGHNVRFDAYSADQNNPDTIDGFGQEYWDGTSSFTNNKMTSLPTMN